MRGNMRSSLIVKMSAAPSEPKPWKLESSVGSIEVNGHIRADLGTPKELSKISWLQEAAITELRSLPVLVLN